MNIWVPIILLLIILRIIIYNFTTKKEDESVYPSLIAIFIILCVISFYIYFYRKDITTNCSSMFVSLKKYNSDDSYYDDEWERYQILLKKVEIEGKKRLEDLYEIGVSLIDEMNARKRRDYFYLN